MFPHQQPFSAYGAHLPPETRGLHQQLEQEMQNMRSDMARRMQLLEHDMDLQSRHLSSLPPAYYPGSGQNSSDNFEMTMDVGDFSSQELTVNTEGRRLNVMGKRGQKRQTEDGQVVEEIQEWHREVEIPEGVNPEHVQCSLSHDGQLHLEAPRLSLPAANNRLLPIMGPRASRTGISPYPSYR